jgi:hypothetical protein
MSYYFAYLVREQIPKNRALRKRKKNSKRQTKNPINIKTRISARQIAMEAKDLNIPRTQKTNFI